MMGSVKIPYYVVKHGMGYFQPTPRMKAQGFQSIACGPDGPAAWRLAKVWADKWAEHQNGEIEKASRPPKGSLAEAWERYRATAEWQKKAVRTREEWERCWSRIGPVFGFEIPKHVDMEDVSQFRALVAEKVSQREAHRIIKIWRALWQVAASLKYCDADKDPSFGVRNTEPAKRQLVWREPEIRRLVKRAWRMGYKGLAAVIAVGWDSMLSPVDVRQLTPGQRLRDEQGGSFQVSRAKTGRAAAGTFTRRSGRILDAYIATLRVDIAHNAPIFRNRSGLAYSKDTLGDDFRAVRAAEFGTSENRTLADMRRSGAVEALRGGAKPGELSSKMANNLSTSNFLQQTYLPVDLDTVRKVDADRKRGRKANRT